MKFGDDADAFYRLRLILAACFIPFNLELATHAIFTEKRVK